MGEIYHGRSPERGPESAPEIQSEWEPVGNYMLVVDQDNVLKAMRMGAGRQPRLILANNLSLEYANKLLRIMRNFLTTLRVDMEVREFETVDVRQATLPDEEGITLIQVNNSGSMVLSLDAVGPRPIMVMFGNSLNTDPQSYWVRIVVFRGRFGDAEPRTYLLRGAQGDYVALKKLQIQ